MTVTVTLNPYLNFRGTAREAMEFYHSVFGGELNAQTFADFGASVTPEDANQLMHAQLNSDNGLVLMGSDVPDHMEWAAGKNTFSVSLSGDDDAVLRDYWAKLADGGTITEPLGVAPWGDAFGMLVDRIGITWLVNISPKAA